MKKCAVKSSSPPLVHQISSILSPVNQKYLASKGYYRQQGWPKGTFIDADDESADECADAASRRKNFQKTRRHWSMCDSNEQKEEWAEERRDPHLSTTTESSTDSLDTPNPETEKAFEEIRRQYNASLSKRSLSAEDLFLPASELKPNYFISPASSRQATVEKCPTLKEQSSADGDKKHNDKNNNQSTELDGSTNVEIVVSGPGTDQTGLGADQRWEKSPFNLSVATIYRASSDSGSTSSSGTAVGSLSVATATDNLDAHHLSAFLVDEPDDLRQRCSRGCQTELIPQPRPAGSQVKLSALPPSINPLELMKRLQHSQDELTRMGSIQSDSSGFYDTEEDINKGSHLRLNGKKASMLACKSKQEIATQTVDVSQNVHTEPASYMTREPANFITTCFIPSVQPSFIPSVQPSSLSEHRQVFGEPQSRDAVHSDMSQWGPCQSRCAGPVRNLRPLSVELAQATSAAPSAAPSAAHSSVLSSLFIQPAANSHTTQFPPPATSSHTTQFPPPATSSHTTQFPPPATSSHTTQFPPPATSSHITQFPATNSHTTQFPPLAGNLRGLTSHSTPRHLESQRSCDILEDDISEIFQTCSEGWHPARCSLHYCHSLPSQSLSRDDLDSSGASIQSTPVSTSAAHKLARLINRPIYFKGSKCQGSQYRPKHYFRDWGRLAKKKRLQEENHLLEYAIQKYKTDISLMETSFMIHYHTLYQDMTAEERDDIQELEWLWSEVRAQVMEMEKLLLARIRSVHSGNDFHSLLSSLGIIDRMIELLKEQVYLQQICHQDSQVFEDDSITHDNISLDKMKSSVSSTVMRQVKMEIEETRKKLESDLKARDADIEQLKSHISSTRRWVPKSRSKFGFSTPSRTFISSYVTPTRSRSRVVEGKVVHETDV
ncbi:uncharacterized protein LOC131929372 [Physella acuta]|uniref:uncharacterized protein LOC131929372 n=1 Tax=Physella acuta TaxID=109671 RepID=UPI0027DCE713|nr:uncharacterized protein LOC131929372 [Physella acuta]XP_059141505.1 uncharacterized protein LOC131929372 [Physella acuta]